jgi:hypothetical protein
MKNYSKTAMLESLQHQIVSFPVSAKQAVLPQKAKVVDAEGHKIGTIRDNTFYSVGDKKAEGEFRMCGEYVAFYRMSDEEPCGYLDDDKRMMLFDGTVFGTVRENEPLLVPMWILIALLLVTLCLCLIFFLPDHAAESENAVKMLLNNTSAHSGNGKIS